MALDERTEQQFPEWENAGFTSEETKRWNAQNDVQPYAQSFTPEAATQYKTIGITDPEEASKWRILVRKPNMPSNIKYGIEREIELVKSFKDHRFTTSDPK